MAAAHWADVVRLEPLYDALRVERVAHVAAQRRYLVAFFKVYEADDAVVDAPEATLVVAHTRRVVNDTGSGALLGASIAPLGDQACDNAGAEDDHDDRNTERDESLRKDEAHDDGKDSQAEARIRVIAMRCEAFKSTKHIDGPHSVKDTHNCLQDEDAKCHPIFSSCH